MTSSKNFIFLVTSDAHCSRYDVEIKEYDEVDQLPIRSPKNPRFFEQLPSLPEFNQIKAFIFTSHDLDFSTPAEDLQYRQKCQAFAQKHGIFFYFLNQYKTDAFAAISQTKTMVKEGEEVLVVHSVAKLFPPFIIMLKRENGFYKIISIECSRCPPFSPTWKKDVLGAHKPKAIILMQNTQCDYDINAAGKMKKLFKGENFKSIFPKDSKTYIMTSTAEIVQHLMGDKISEYYIKPACVPKIEIRVDGNVLIKVGYSDTVPFKKSVVIDDVNSKKNVSLYCTYAPVGTIAARTLKLVKEIKLSTFKCKKVKIILKIDSSSFYDFNIEPIVEKVVIEPDSARMIFDRQYFSVSYFSNNKENILTDSNASKKTPIYISFAEKKPIIGRDAQYSYVENPESVVFDLIKLCSVSNADVTNPNWDFKLSKEIDSIIVTMQTYDGEKKSTVDFLLALILKNGNDRIKKAYGKRMKDIEIAFEGFTANEILKKNFIEAGKLLNVNIVFV